MFGFPRNGRKESYRSRHSEDPSKSGPGADEKWPDRPTLDGYLVCELPESLSDALLKAFVTRTA